MRNSRSGPVPVVVMGLGYIGQEIARAALLSPELDIVGAVDLNPALVGKSLAQIVAQAGTEVRVSSTLAEARGRSKRPVLLHATGSRLRQIAGQLFEAIEE